MVSGELRGSFSERGGISDFRALVGMFSLGESKSQRKGEGGIIYIKIKRGAVC